MWQPASRWIVRANAPRPRCPALSARVETHESKYNKKVDNRLFDIVAHKNWYWSSVVYTNWETLFKYSVAFFDCKDYKASKSPGNCVKNDRSVFIFAFFRISRSLDHKMTEMGWNYDYQHLSLRWQRAHYCPFTGLSKIYAGSRQRYFFDFYVQKPCGPPK